MWWADTLSLSWQWLLLPMSGSSHHEIEPEIYWHARLMVIAWAIFLPLGALIARYFKVTPRQDWPRVLDNKFWWHCHRGLQYLSLVLMGLGMLVWLFFAPLPERRAELALTCHQALGYVVLLAGFGQMMGGIFRGSKGGPTEAKKDGDHFNMTAWRVSFEWLHKILGWTSIILAVLVIVLGLLIVDAPRWMPCALFLWWMGLLAIGIVLQRRGLCIDTYQAIWGVDPSLPGLQRKPIGWGVRRTSRNPWH